VRRLLVANRGEIAIRILRAARDLGVETVAVYSTADTEAPHVRMADRAVEIGPPQAAQSYLNVDALLDAARATDADAVHPGYGFLAESARFARACRDAGLAFVGPDAETIDRMGDKVAARAVAEAAGVPTVAGSDGPVEGLDAAAAAAEAVGYPLMLKAAGGGGGRGIRVLFGPEELEKGVQGAAREAEAAFGDARLYVERFMERARHVEVQVMGDGSDAVHLFERECSLQRRRQKVVEEALSPGASDAVRERIAEASVRLCREVGYASAGTLEFLLDDATGEAYFIEMNTRIQVEHPVTELILGVDLVAEQLRIAAGEPLSLRQEALVPRGHALELRITAEDPDRKFLPSPGRAERVVLPAGPWVRFDTWLEPGAEVVPFYDSLLGKLIVWGEDRPRALARARRALAEFEVTGIRTTASVLARLLDEEWFAAADFHTRTLEDWLAQEVPA
jgi:acetyl-CoA carboxylase biotin carboxylase subunit